MTDIHEAVREEVVTDVPEEGARRPTLPLAAHLLILAVVLAGLSLLFPFDEPWSADDGAYYHAVRLVRDEGQWYEARPDLDLTDHPRRYPLALSQIDDQGRAFPYVKHPAWILLQVGSTTLFGDHLGMVLPGLVAVMVASGLAWKGALRLGGSPALAFWLVALGPLAITAFGYWAHAVMAALGGIAALQLVRLVRRPSLVSAALLAGVGASLVLLRSEGVLFVAALVVALGLARVRRRATLRAWIDVVVVLLVPLVTYVGERLWVDSLFRSTTTAITEPPEPATSWLGGRASGAWHTIGLSTPSTMEGQVLLAAATALAILGLVARARGDRGPVPVALVATGAAMMPLLAATGRIGMVSGLVAAWPAVAAGIIAGAAARVWRTAEERSLLVLAVGFTVLVLATQYAHGGGVDWGGRFMAPVAVPLAIIAASGLTRAARPTGSVAGTDGTSRPQVPVAWLAGLSAVALLMAGTAIVDDRREEATSLLDDVRTTQPDIAIVEAGAFLPRYDVTGASDVWARTDRVGGLGEAAERAFADGAERVTLVGLRATDVRVPGTTREVVGDSVVLLVLHR